MKKTHSLMMSTLLLMSLLAFAFNIPQVKASTIIYIRPDGSVDPSNEPIQRNGDFYNLTANIFDSIMVERDNIVIDGNGYALRGSGDGTGICLSGRQNVTIRRLQISNFAIGIILGGLGCFSSYNCIIGNNITSNINDGIFLDYYSNSNIITGNLIAKNTNGIYLYCSSSNNITKNNITRNDYAGILLTYSSNQNGIYQNNITNNWCGVSIEHSSYNNIYRNNFIGNTQQASSSASTNVWNNDNPALGNYWSDYEGSDKNGDGIGDTTYIIDSGNIDKFPHMTQLDETSNNSSKTNANQEGNQQTASPTPTPTPIAQGNPTPTETPYEPEKTADPETDEPTPSEEEWLDDNAAKRELEFFVWFVGITIAVTGVLLLLVKRRLNKKPAFNNLKNA